MASSSSSAMTSLKEAKDVVDKLEAKADKLEAKVDKLKAKVDKLQAEVKELASDPSKKGSEELAVAKEAWTDAKEAWSDAKEDWRDAKKDWRDAKKRLAKAEDHQRMLELARAAATATAAVSVSQSSPSKGRNATSKLADRLKLANSRLGWNVKAGPDGSELTPDALAEIPAESLDEMWRRLGLHSKAPLLEESTIELDFHLDDLQSEVEEKVQAKLEDEALLKQAKVKKGSYKRCNGPFYKWPQNKYYARTAKPDWASLVLALYLEIKSDSRYSPDPGPLDWECFLQALERVETTMANCAYLSGCFALACTGHSRWFLYAARERHEDPRVVTVHIVRLESDSRVERVWMSLTAAAEANPTLFLTFDGPHIVRALAAAGVRPPFCRVKFVGRGSSNVYELILQGRGKDGSGATIDQLAVEPDDSICMKVCHDDTFEREKAALDRIAKNLPPKVLPLFYYLGTLSYTEKEVQWSRVASLYNAQVQSLLQEEEEKTEDPTDWWQLDKVKLPDTTGGVIFMVKGKPATELSNAAAWDELRLWLSLYHAAGVAHADLRQNNVVEIRGRLQFVDFGLSVLLEKQMSPSGTSVFSSGNATLVPGSRSKRAGYGIRQQLDTKEPRWREPDEDFALTLPWGPLDDYDMLAQTILRLWLE